jgi:hypothetical protein
MSIGDHEPHAAQPALHRAAQERGPEGRVLRRARVEPEDLAFPVRGHADGHDRRQALDAAVLAHLVVGRIDPEIRMLSADCPCAKCLDLRIERRASVLHDTDSSPLTLPIKLPPQGESPCIQELRTLP